jgi:hypothetical protein
MKTKLLFSFLLFTFAFFLLPCTAQVPQGFNYQAIARDGSGNILANQALPVKIDIQTSLTGGSLIYEELFASVTSNQFGLISLVIGTGTQQGGSAASFSAIDWKAQTLFLKTIIQYPGTTWTPMGTSQIWGVPYSLVAKDVAGPLTKLGIVGTTDNMEEALFEVKNKGGKTVFAVYNEGVRAYVGNGDAKGAKGGFSVGGYDGAKGVHDLLWVTSDSVRVYIDSDPSTKGAKGGFSVGGYDMSKGTISSYLDVTIDSTSIVKPAENRILWYPLKNAFLTGKVLIENRDSVGINSFASGFQSKAKGDWSQALGFMSIARGNYSSSIGKNSIASGNSSFAFGDQAKATGISSYAFGTRAKAIGNLSFALGSVGVDQDNKSTGPTIASGYGAFALGFGSVSSSQGAFSFGVQDTASGPFSLAMGYLTRAKGWFSSTTGFGTLVETGGSNGLATGFFTKAGNWAASSFGDESYASGHTSFATGYKSVASGQLSSTFGDQTISQSYGSVAIGKCNISSGSATLWVPTDPVFAIGNGSSPSARSNAMTVYKNGNTDLAGNINLIKGKGTLGIGALYVDGSEAIWYDGNCYSWGFGGTYNVFADHVSVGTTANPGSYSLYVVGNAYSTGTWGASDFRWKKNIADIGNVLDKVAQLNSVNYEWKQDEFPDMHFDSGTQIGLIAQDVEKVFPALVRTDDNGYKAVSYEKLSVILLEGMKEQQKQIESQKQENQQLKADLQSMKEEMDQIKAMMADGSSK